MAFIDGQNLHLGTKRDGWAIDHVRFRVYLKEKYEIIEAYYFLGFISDKEQRLYDLLKEAGFTLIHKEHLPTLRAAKKGNVDSDIIFEVMKKLVENEPVRKIFIISGDGDYKKLVDFLVSKELFGKILFPNKKSISSLYFNMGSELFDYLGETDIRAKIEYAHK